MIPSYNNFVSILLSVLLSILLSLSLLLLLLPLLLVHNIGNIDNVDNVDNVDNDKTVSDAIKIIMISSISPSLWVKITLGLGLG